MYRASSVVSILKDNKDIVIYGVDLVSCPIESCYVKPIDCSKGQDKICEKKVELLYSHDNHNKVAILIFRYKLSNIDNDGFIKKNDTTLNMLLKRNIITADSLVSV
jgi:hypothetical protein